MKIKLCFLFFQRVLDNCGRPTAIQDLRQVNCQETKVCFLSFFFLILLCCYSTRRNQNVLEAQNERIIKLSFFNSRSKKSMRGRKNVENACRTLCYYRNYLQVLWRVDVMHKLILFIQFIIAKQTRMRTTSAASESF